MRKLECLTGARRRGLEGVSLLALLTAMGAGSAAPAAAQSLPVNGRVTAGSVIIAKPGASSLLVKQSTDRGIVTWSDFSVGKGNTVTFQQPSTASATLNRVDGHAPSTIAGQVKAN